MTTFLCGSHVLQNCGQHEQVVVSFEGDWHGLIFKMCFITFSRFVCFNRLATEHTKVRQGEHKQKKNNSTNLLLLHYYSRV